MSPEQDPPRGGLPGRDPDDPGGQDGLDGLDDTTGTDDESVRRLLGAAATPAPTMPDQVAVRLDGVLAGLVAGRTEEPATPPATPPEDVTGAAPPVVLAERRRRRWPQVLVAAAAVSVLGLGVGNLLQSPQAENAMTADAPADREEAGDVAGESAQDGGGDTGASSGAEDGVAEPLAEESPEPAPREDRAETPVMRLRSDNLTEDVQRAADFDLGQTPQRRASSCVRPRPRAGPGDETLPVRLDGRRALLVLRAPDGGQRVGEVFLCGGDGDPVETTTVGAR